MIDLTPLDVRNKRGDFKRLMRGYDPQEVDVFLEMTADRLEVLVRENMQLKERTQALQDKVSTQTDREQAVQDALVTAQELRADIRARAQQEAEQVVDEASAEADRLVADAKADAKRLIAEAEAESIERLRDLERRLEDAGATIQDLERRRIHFLKEFKGLLARELDVVEVEEGKLPFEERAIDLELGSSRATERVMLAAEAVSETAEPTVDPVATDDDDEPSVHDDEETGAGRPDAHDGSAPGGGLAEAVAPPVAPSQVGDAARRGAEADRGATGGGEGDDMRPDTPLPYPVLKVPTDRRDGRDEDPHRSVRFSVDMDREGRAKSRASTEDAIDVSDLRPAVNRFADVPDLETVLAEAGVEEVSPPDDDGPDNSFIHFDFDDKGEKD